MHGFACTALALSIALPLSAQAADSHTPEKYTIDAFNCGTNPMNKKDECGDAASAQIKRSDFGIKYALPAVGDDVKLVFEIEAIKN